jgi:branched-chain amino acid transport system permease protein
MLARRCRAAGARDRRGRAYALFVGALGRTRGVYFIMVTLAFAQMAYFVVHDTKAGSSDDHLLRLPVLAIGRHRPRRAAAVSTA